MPSNVVSIEQPRFVKAEVIAARYGVSRETIMRGARKGTIPAKCIKNGGVKGIWMFDPAAVDAAFNNNYTNNQQAG
jgi:hypothetical protein